MAAFAQFSSDLDPSTQQLLARGARLTEILKQGQFDPMSIEEQVISIFAGVNGYLDPIPLDAVTRFEEGMLSAIRADHGDILAAIRDEQEISDDTETRLKAALDSYAKTFVAA